MGLGGTNATRISFAPENVWAVEVRLRNLGAKDRVREAPLSTRTYFSMIADHAKAEF